MKYEIPKLTDDAYAAVGQVIRQISSVEGGLRVLRNLCTEDTTTGVLQRTVIDRALSLLPEPVERDTCLPLDKRSSNERKLKNDNVGTEATSATATRDSTKTDYPDVIKVPQRSRRPKKLSEKAKDNDTLPGKR